MGVAMENKAIGVRELASHLSLSVASVSRAMNNLPGVGERTRQRVLEAAAQMGYVPDARAQLFRNRHTHQIGIVLPSLDDPTFIEKVREAHSTAWELGYDVAFVSTERDPRREAAVWKHLLSRRVDGVISLNTIDWDASRLAIEEQGVRVLLITSVDENSTEMYARGGDAIHVDAGHGLRESADHLLQLGHRRIGLLGFRVRRKHPIHMVRAQAFRKQVDRFGLPNDSLCFIETDSDTIEAGYQVMKAWLDAKRPLPTAIQAINDYVAMGAVRALADAGLRVPNDISIVGYSNIDLANFALPRLTTVSHIHLEVGSRAVRMIVKGIETAGWPVSRVELKSSLVVRESTAVPPEK